MPGYRVGMCPPLLEWHYLSPDGGFLSRLQSLNWSSWKTWCLLGFLAASFLSDCLSTLMTVARAGPMWYQLTNNSLVWEPGLSPSALGRGSNLMPGRKTLSPCPLWLLGKDPRREIWPPFSSASAASPLPASLGSLPMLPCSNKWVRLAS